VEDQCNGPGLGPHPALDHEELAAGVVGARLVEADHDLEREDEVAVEVAVQRVPPSWLVTEQQRGRVGLARPVALRQPVLEVVGPHVGPPEQSRSAQSRAIGSRWGQKAARNPVTTSADIVAYCTVSLRRSRVLECPALPAR